jgi:hypothetical protein
LAPTVRRHDVFVLPAITLVRQSASRIRMAF